MRKKKHTIKCPCKSGKTHQTCCKPYLDGLIKPQTPEQLMRSRYTAYATNKMDYILSTMTGPALSSFNASDSSTKTASVDWIGLSVLDTSIQEDTGYVTFEAQYIANNTHHCIHEKSTFIRRDGIWLYYDGIAY